MMKQFAIGLMTLTLMACAEAPSDDPTPDPTPVAETKPIGAYMIVQGKGYVPGSLSEYAAALPPIYEKYGGYYVAFDNNIDVAEGDQDYQSTIISAWSSKEAARAFWDSPEYAEAIKLREGLGTFDVSIVGALPTN